jgi:adenine phosphoribosyltransferase
MGAPMNKVRQLVRDVPDFPKKGITFKDITPVLSDPVALRGVVEAMAARWRDERIDKVVGIESRGFLFASPIAYVLHAGCVLVRKPGKLPWKTVREVYALEYGEDALEIHVDAVAPGERVLIVDDVLATGGTASAAGRLVTRQGAQLVGYTFVIELGFLRGAERLGRENVHALVRYD